MDLSGRRVLLVGGAGLVGSHIVDRLLLEPLAEIVVFDNFVRGRADNLARAAADARVRIVHGSMTNRAELDAALQGIDGVFLLASLWLGECVNDPQSAWDVNVGGTWNVVDACRARGIRRIVYSSSASVYGNALVVPMTEDHPFNNRTTYGATKIACEQMLRAMFDQHRLPYVGMRYMNIYGERMDYHGTYVSVIMKVLDRVFAGEPPEIFGDGSQTYDFIYVGDAADANVLAMKADCVDEFFNVGTGLGTTVSELAHLLLELTGSTLTPRYRAEATSFVTSRIGSTEKAQALLGFTATTPLREGLRRVIEWRTAQLGVQA